MQSFDTFPGQAILKSGIRSDHIILESFNDPNDSTQPPTLVSDDTLSTAESWQWNCEREMFGCFRIRGTNLEQLMFVREQHLKYHQQKANQSDNP